MLWELWIIYMFLETDACLRILALLGVLDGAKERKTIETRWYLVTQGSLD